MNMFRRITAFSAAAVIGFAAALPLAASADEEILIIGDTNGDSLVDATDASDMLIYYSAMSTGGESDWTLEMKYTHDVDGDGRIDATDASYVLMYYSYNATGGGKFDNIIDYVKDLRKPVNYVLAPEGLDPGTTGTIEYIVNTAPRTEHYDIPLYNIKANNIYGGKTYRAGTYELTDEAITALNNFAKEHFTDSMTDYDRIEYTWNWLHENVKYATEAEYQGYQMWNHSGSYCCFDVGIGQCLQYNGAFAEMLAYMGYNSYMLEMWTDTACTIQHYRSEVEINGIYYNTEVGDKGSDNPKTGYKWMWLFNPDKRQFYGVQAGE
ncbi:MAG: hypothetical protein K2J37_04290 [Ruminococcus sp.]|nr:hypothetical protein [Ruminococcus sp.]MDE6784904.1 hypothetical protein [Ruminococcus sp.]